MTKRELTYEEVLDIIEFEDKCGVQNLIQYLFSERDKAILGKNVKVVAEIDEEGCIGKYEVVELKEKDNVVK